MEILSQFGIKTHREVLLEKQDYKCALCKLELLKENAVLDHDHATGAVRGVLHRGCNILLGHIEKSRRWGVPDYYCFSDGVGDYLMDHYTDQTGLYRK